MRTDVFINRENVEKVLIEDFNLQPWEITMVMQQNNKDIALTLNQYYKKKMGNLEEKLLSTLISDLPLANFLIRYISDALKSQCLDRKSLYDLYFVAKGLYGEPLDKKVKELLFYCIRAIEIQLGRQNTLKENFNDKMDIVRENSYEIVEEIAYKRDVEGLVYLPTENFSDKVIKIDSRKRDFLYPIALYSTLDSLREPILNPDPSWDASKGAYIKSLENVLLIKR